MNLIRRLREAPVTIGLIAVNLLVYLVMIAQSRHLISFGNATLIGAGACISGANLEVTHWRCGNTLLYLCAAVAWCIAT